VRSLVRTPFMRYPKRTALAITCACFAVFASAASAAVKPTIISLSVTPRAVPASGGAFTAYVRVRHDVTCTLTFYHGHITKHTFKCSDGHLAWHLRAPPASEVEVLGVCLEANSGHRTSERCVSLSRLGNTHPAAPVSTPTTTTAPPPPPPVVNLDVCTAGPECDYGAAYEHYETWGNIASEGFGDCTFAAAANFEQILFHSHAYPEILGYEFAEAGGTAQEGLAQNLLWKYWEKDGIAGSYLTHLYDYTPTPENVRTGVRDYTAMIAELTFAEGWAFAQYQANAGLHDVVVMGFTPEGPLVVTSGESLQMTWEQWSDEEIGMWGIEATNPNP